MEDEDGHAEQPQFAGLVAERIDVFLHAVADEDDGVDLLPLALGEGVLEDLADLRLAAEAAHGGHLLQQIVGAIEPGARLELAEAAIERELDVEAAERRRLLNISPWIWQARSQVGCRLAVASRANNSRPRWPDAGRAAGVRRQLAEEGIDLAAGRGFVGQLASLAPSLSRRSLLL